MSTIEARRRLSKVAGNYLQAGGHTLSLPARIYLWLLLTKGARRVAREDKHSMATAEENLRTLLDVATRGTGALTYSPMA